MPLYILPRRKSAFAALRLPPSPLRGYGGQVGETAFARDRKSDVWPAMREAVGSERRPSTRCARSGRHRQSLASLDLSNGGVCGTSFGTGLLGRTLLKH